MKLKTVLKRTIVYEDRFVEKIRVRKERIIKQIKEMLEKDEEMLAILKKL